MVARRRAPPDQTATGSRYSPKTSRRTPHISPRVAYASAHADEVRHQVRVRRAGPSGRFAQALAARSPRAAASRSPRVRSSRAMCASRDSAGTLEHRHRVITSSLVHVAVDARRSIRSPIVELALEAVGRVGDLALRVARRDRPRPCRRARRSRRGSATPARSTSFGERLDEPRAAERIDGAGHAGLLGDHLLLAEREQRRLRRWARRAPRRTRRCGATACRREPRRAPGSRRGSGCSAAAAASATRRRSGCGSASRSSARSRRDSARSSASHQIRRAARNLAISSKKSLCELKKNDSRGAKSSTRSPRSIAASTYAIPSAIVNASSWTAVEPASRMW